LKIEIKNQKLFIALIALLGLIISAELCFVFYNANFVLNAMPSFCTINSVIDCDAVAKTGFSLLFGIPLSVYGVLFYLFVLLLSLFPFKKYRFSEKIKNPESLIFTLSTFSVISSVILAVISFFFIHKICILCMILYLVNILLFVISKLGKPIFARYKEFFQEFTDLISDKRWLAFIVVMILIFAALIFTANYTKIFTPKKENNSSSSEEIKPEEFKSLMMQRFELPERIPQPKGNILGDKNPRLIIRVFTDFECPFCAIFNSMMYAIANEVKGVRIEHHDYPLNSECNPYVPQPIHKNSCIAAYYAYGAKMQGKSWEYITLLFDNQETISEDKLIELAKSINIDINRLKIDAHSEEAKRSLADDVNMANNLNINATPTFFIGMKKYEGIMPYPELKQTIIDSMK